MSVFLACLLRSAFLGHVSSLPSHWQLLCFCSGSRTLNHDSSPVTTVHRNRGSWVNPRFSRQTDTLKSFWSCVRMRGTNFGAFFLRSRSCRRILWTVALERLVSAEICLTVALLSRWTTSSTARTFNRVLITCCLPGLGKSFPLLSPAFALRYHLLHVDLDRLSSA